ncbi:uncharacterized protein [Periplaneta americana]|uniref:uncharacterized protein isoform X3 n=1 Tax=Periplaneta americana TaxID=6978 RepID=UPI0037E7A175
MDVIKIEREIDPVAIERSNINNLVEENSLSQERNFLDHHVTGIKEEYEDQSQDLTSEITFKGDPVPISFPMVKREPEFAVAHSKDPVVCRRIPNMAQVILW